MMASQRGAASTERHQLSHRSDESDSTSTRPDADAPGAAAMGATTVDLSSGGGPSGSKCAARDARLPVGAATVAMHAPAPAVAVRSLPTGCVGVQARECISALLSQRHAGVRARQPIANSSALGCQSHNSRNVVHEASQLAGRSCAKVPELLHPFLCGSQPDQLRVQRWLQGRRVRSTRAQCQPNRA